MGLDFGGGDKKHVNLIVIVNGKVKVNVKRKMERNGRRGQSQLLAPLLKIALLAISL